MSETHHHNLSRREWIKGIASAAVAGTAVRALTSCVGRQTDQTTTSAATAPWPDADSIIESLPGTIGCTGCEECMPCGYGVDIPAMFALYDEALAKGEIPRSLSDLDTPEGLRRASAFLTRAENEIGDRHLAHRCIACAHCLPHCPEKIRIISILNSIGRLIDLIRERQCL